MQAQVQALFPFDGDATVNYNGTHIEIKVTCNGKPKGAGTFAFTDNSKPKPPPAPTCEIGSQNVTIVEGNPDPKSLGPFTGKALIQRNSTHTIITNTCEGTWTNAYSMTTIDDTPTCTIGE